MDFSLIKIIIDKSSILLVLLISSFAIQFSLIYARQHWVKTFTATITFLLLPIISAKTNVALSTPNGKR